MRLATLRLAARFCSRVGDRRVRSPAVDRHRRLTPPTIETPRLRLRPLRGDDLDAFAAIWADPRVTSFIGGTPRPRADVWLRMLATEGHWRWLGYGYWIVERDGELIGNAGFADFKRDIVPALDAPEVGWAYAADHWGQGYASEVLAAMVAWADAQRWTKTVAIIDPGNAASARVAEKMGYSQQHTAQFNGAVTRVYARAQAG